MAFSEAQFQAVVDEMNSGLSDLSDKIGQIRPIAESAVDHWYVPDFVADAVLWLADKAISLAKTIWDKIVELLKGVAAPVYFFKYALDWEDIRGLASGVSGELNPAVLPAGKRWKGTAADAYSKIIPLQGNAATHIGTIADKTAVALGICAAAGVAFYVTLGIILVKILVAMGGVIASIVSVVLSWVGVTLAVEEVAVDATMLTVAVTALTAVLTAQAGVMVALHGEAGDISAFPGGHWPDPTTGLYNDSSVRDGTASWSYAR
ncbi:MAG: hypothetical protein ACRDQ4_23925 [Pseudonocardiaceae bacterium]